MFEELYKFISRLHYGIKFMLEKDFDELLSRCDWEQKMYALYSYLLPTVKIGNAIMDFREKYTLPDCKKKRGGRDEE